MGKNIDATISKFQWQAGYGAFSVSYSNIARVERYIANQETHHRNEHLLHGTIVEEATRGHTERWKETNGNDWTA